MMNKSIIISGFPGVGKTFAAELPTVLDLDSSPYHYPQGDPYPGPQWIGHYGNAIIREQEKNEKDYILISSHKAVRRELQFREIDYIIVVPDILLRNQYMKRYLSRGSSIKFIKTIYDNWFNWLGAIQEEPAPIITLSEGEYLSDILGASPFRFNELIINKKGQVE